MQQFPADLLDGIRIHLEDQKKQVANRILELSKQDPFADPDRAIDNAASDTEASEEFNHDRVTAIIEELTIQLAQIDAALNRIGNGAYGFCAICKEMIDTDRLSIMPEAIFCLSCESKKRHEYPHSL